jgi:hypothetical protein
MVSSVVSGPDGTPVFVVKKISRTDNAPSDDGLTYGGVTSFVAPQTGSRFTLLENLSDSANWNPVSGTISLVDFTATGSAVVETRTDSEQNTFYTLAGGIHGNAVIQPALDQAGIAIPGYYTVSFADGTALAPHPQQVKPYDPSAPDNNPPDQVNTPYVEWYQGLIRVPLAADSAARKLLSVARILQTSPLTLIVADPDYQNPDAAIQVSATADQAVTGVNYHPGYRAYLLTDPAAGHLFGRDQIMPQGTALSKKTLLALQNCDNRAGGSGFTSPISVPAVLFARRIEQPQRPEAPSNFGLKVRANVTGKALFTFDIRVGPDGMGNPRSPFGMSFFRTNHEHILEALYQPETVAQILTDLAALTSDPFYEQRYLELANLTYDPASPGSFAVHDAQPAPYGFPVPNKTGLVDPADSPDQQKAKYRAAITATLLPLTRQVPVLNYVKTGYQTENKVPVIRDAGGSLLDPASPDFDPFPMIRKYTKTEDPGAIYLRFSDYSLSVTSRFLYFYTAAETTNQLLTGEMSAFTGPVTVLQTLPPEKPLVRKYTITTDDTATPPVSVNFTLAPFSAADGVSKIRLYRSTDPNATYALEAMDEGPELELTSEIADAIFTDNFADLASAPLGETVYYRMAGIRPISNEAGQPEEILSEPSEVLAVRLIDTVNPVAPTLQYSADNGLLSWMPTVKNGTYTVFQLTARGNWQKLGTAAFTAMSTPMTFPVGTLPKTGEDGNTIYYTFKVTVANTSGLFNLNDNLYTY